MLAMKKQLEALTKAKGEAPKQEKTEEPAVADMHKEVAPEADPASCRTGGTARDDQVLAGRLGRRDVRSA